MTEDLSQPDSPTGKTLAGLAFARLRRDILRGALKPGERLRFEQMKARYGISLSPLREALSRMAAAGLVTAEDNRGYCVSPISLEDLLEINGLRTELEVMAMRQSIERGGDDWEVGIVSAFHLLKKHVSAENGPGQPDDEWERRHRAFHIALISACDSPRLLDFLLSLTDQADRYRRLAESYPQIPRDAIGEHQAIMEAALDRDSARACGLLEAHFRKTVEIILAANPGLDRGPSGSAGASG